MLSITVNLNDAGALSGIAAIKRCMEDKATLHASMGEAVKDTVVNHLREINARSPHTNFYTNAAEAADKTAVDATAERAEVTLAHKGLALRLHGGRVLPKNVINLALPTEHVPVLGGEERARPREMGILAFIPHRGGPSVTTGYLVEGEEITGKRSGRKRIIPKPGGHMMYVLRGWTDHDPDSSVLPTIAAMQESARAAAAAVIEVHKNEGGKS